MRGLTGVLARGALAMLVLLLPASGHGATVCPSGCNFLTISDALSGAPQGETVTVFPGVYSEPRLTVTGRILRSLQPTNPDATTILNNSGQSVIQASNATIEGFTITGGSGSHGGGVSINGGIVTLRHLTIRGNTAGFGGGVGGITGSTTVLIESCTIENNSATQHGGGVEGLPGQTTILDSTITMNTVNQTGPGSGSGGGVFLPPGANNVAVIRNTQITMNSADGTVNGRGGGLFSGGAVNLSAVTVAGNMALSGSQDSLGGGMYASGATFVSGGSFTGNTAGQGGGIFASSGQNVDIRTSVTSNVATGLPQATAGGGIFCSLPIDNLGGTIGSNSLEEVVGCGSQADPADGTKQATEDAQQSGNTADPVDTRTGALYDAFEADLDLGGPMRLAFARSYNSAHKQLGLHANLGDNWRHGFDWRLTRIGSKIHIVDAPGRTIQFAQNGAVWDLTGKLDIPYQLDESGGSYTLLDPRDRRVYAFDAAGRLTSISDGRGNVHTLSYANGPLTQVSDGLGRSLSFSYDANVRLLAVDDGLGRSVGFGYTGSLLTSITDVNGETTLITYSTAHPNLTPWALITTLQRPEGNIPFEHRYWFADRRTSQELDSNGNQTVIRYVTATDTTITDPLGRLRTHTHSATGELTRSQDATGQDIVIGSDATGRRSSITDRLGDTTTMSFHPQSGELGLQTHADGTATSFSYSPRNLGAHTAWDLTGVTHGDLSTESFAYDASGNRTSHTDQAGNVSTATHDANGQPLTITNRLGGLRSFAYGPDGTLESATDPAGNTTTYAHDIHGRVELVTSEDTSTVALSYDAADRLTTFTDGNGNTTTLGYDRNGNLVSVTDPLLASLSLAYDGNDRLLSRTEPGGGVSSVTYDEIGRVGTFTDASGAVTTYGYDAHNRLSTAVDPLLQVWSQTRDAEGILTSHTDPLMNTTTFGSDRLGRITQIVTPLGNVRSTGYDAMGRVVTTTDPLGRTTSIGRDARGLVSAVTLPGGVIGATYARNALGQLTDLTDADGHHWTRSYDSSGRVTGFTDPLLQTTSVTYDDRNRPSVVTHPGGLGDRMHSYDPVGRPTGIDDSDGTIRGFGWDANGRLIAGHSGGPDDLTRSYDADGRMASTNGIGIGRDPNGRITSMTLATNKTVSFSYDANGRLTSATDWAAGVTTFSYDDSGRRTAILRPNGVHTTETWDDDDRLTGISETGVSSVVLGRDAAGQITSAVRNVPQPGSATLLGSRTDTFDPAAQVQAQSHDPAGRVTASGGDTFTWDLAGRLTGSTVGGASATHLYDALGRRTARTESGVTRGYVWNDALSLPSISVEMLAGADHRYYVHTPSGELLYSMDAISDARRFHHYDEIGNTLFVTDDVGAVIGSYAYTPFGELTASAGSLDNPFTWRGRDGVVDEGNGLYYVRARWYDAGRGRFLSRDPARLTDPQSANPYSYALNDPLRITDVTGFAPRRVSSGSTADPFLLQEVPGRGPIERDLSAQGRPPRRVQTIINPIFLVDRTRQGTADFRDILRSGLSEAFPGHDDPRRLIFGFPDIGEVARRAYGLPEIEEPRDPDEKQVYEEFTEIFGFITHRNRQAIEGPLCPDQPDDLMEPTVEDSAIEDLASIVILL